MQSLGPVRALDSWWLDLKLGIRMLFKYPGLTLAAGAGIAVAVAIAAGGFSVIHGTFLSSSLLLEEGDRIVAVELWDTVARKPQRRSAHDFQIWREDLRSVQEISAFQALTPNLITPGQPPESVRVAAMTASSFEVARVRPLLGRYVTQDDEHPGAPPVVVIGEMTWRNRFASDPTILGRTIQLGATHHSIVGIMPAAFAFPVNHSFWVPLRLGLAPPEPLTGPDLTVFGRLAPGATLTTAQAELSAIGQRATLADPKMYSAIRPLVAPYTRPIMGLHGQEDLAGILVMEGLIVSLLVLVCLNVSVLVYTRTTMRKAEIGLRTALGASRGRIVAQLFIEALVISVFASAAGIGIAILTLRQVAAATQPIASELPYWVNFRLSPQAVLYAAVLSVVAAAIISVAPALRATGRQMQTGLRIVRAGDSGMRLGKTWTVLIVAQVGFAVALLPPAALSSWGSIRDGIAGPGFAAEQFLSAQLGMDSMSGTTAAATPAMSAEHYATRQAELLRQLEAEPRVAGVTFAMTHPGDERGARIEAQGLAESDIPEVRYNRVAVNFFKTLDVPLLAGRSLEPADIAGANRVVVVNQPLAEKLFGGHALGRRIRYPSDGESAPWYEIVGIVNNFPTGVSAEMSSGDFKVYHAAAVGEVKPAAITVRMRSGPPAAVSQRLREIAAAVDPELHLRDIRGLDETLRREQWIRRLEAAVLLAITISVLLLSSAGIYALMSFTVSQRRREIGIRIALGSTRERILGAIFSRALMQLLSGAVLGAVLGTALLKVAAEGSRQSSDAAPVLLAVVVIILTVGFLAALGPALRSLRIEPTDALREQ